MTDYHDHCIANRAPKAAPDSLVSLIKESNTKLDAIVENTTPAEQSENNE
jgi:hypothetical protein